MTRTLTLWWGGAQVGSLTQRDDGRLRFVYAAEWLARPDTPALSVSLPKRPEPFAHRACRPFFGGLLPEAEPRDAAAHALGVSSGNDFALLDRLGGDVAGALQLLPANETPLPRAQRAAPVALDEDGLLRVLDDLPLHPLLAGQAGLRLSLAGAQSKVPVVLVDGHIALPAPGQPTTHILKPPIARFAATTENEAFVMRLASAVGLDVAAVEPRVVRGRPLLLIQRYDRQVVGDTIERLHQEDFCQALGVPPEMKYASEGGPTFKSCFALVRRVAAAPALDLLKLLDATIFNVTVGNADAHGKSFSLLYDERGPRLASLYDLLATVVYPGLSPALAMRIGKRSTLAELDRTAWASFAKETGLGLPLVRRRIAELTDSVAARADEVARALVLPGLDEGALLGFAALVRERAARLAASS